MKFVALGKDLGDGTRLVPMPVERASPSAVAARRRFGGVGGLLLLVLLVSAAGCGTPVSFPPVDLKEPGWTVQSGEAVWKRGRESEGIAGEFLAATRSDGRAFVQLSKDAFPLAVGQKTPDAWIVEFPLQNKHYSGRGQVPSRIILLQLPRVLAGLRPPEDISWQPRNEGGGRLENRSSGESLDVYLDP
jgi:hypothetical protein